MASGFFSSITALLDSLFTTIPKEVVVTWDNLSDYLASVQDATATSTQPSKVLKIDFTQPQRPAKIPEPRRSVDILPLIVLHQQYPRMRFVFFHHQQGSDVKVQQDCEEIMHLVELKSPNWLAFVRNSVDRIEVYRMIKYCGYINFVLKPGQEPEGFVEAEKREGVHMASFPYLRDMGVLQTLEDSSDMFIIAAKEMEEKR